MLWGSTDDLERRVRSHDPESSWEAARIDRDDAAGIRDFIVHHLRIEGPSTDEAIHEAYLDAGGTRTPQRLRTERAALVFPKDGEPIVRAARTRGTSRLGNSCTRWELI
jgi:hypothetical protein